MGSIDETQLQTSTADSTSSIVKLKIAVIGAGIAGLAAAIALTDSGHDVEILEKSRFANEIGAGIHMTPNSSRILKHYGFDFEAAKASEADAIVYMSADTGEITNTMNYPDCTKKYGSPWLLFHRSDLHNELKRHALDETSVKRKPATLRLQTEVKAVDKDGTIHLSNGETLHKDLVIIANGIHTSLIEKVTETPVQTVAAGLAMIRFLIPMEEVAKDPRAKGVYDAGLTNFIYSMKGDRNFVSYPCRSQTMANCGFFHKDTVDWKDTWSRHSSKEELLKNCEGYNDMFVALCEKANDVSEWRLAVREEPVQKLVRDRLVLVGDALHPMLPFLGQGGAMAVEDAAALGVFLSSLKSVDQVPERLRLYQELRVNRVSAMQILSNWGVKGYEKVLEECKPYFPSSAPPADRHEINDWCFAGDVRKDAVEMLHQHLAKA